MSLTNNTGIHPASFAKELRCGCGSEKKKRIQNTTLFCKQYRAWNRFVQPQSWNAFL